MPQFSWVTTFKADGPYENEEQLSEEEKEEMNRERESVIENYIEIMNE